MQALTQKERLLSQVEGPKKPELWRKTIGQVLKEQVQLHGHKTAVAVPWQQERLSYIELERRSIEISKALLASGIRNGQRVAVMAGNRSEYLKIFLGAGRVGVPLVVLNTAYTPAELRTSLSKASCAILFIAVKIGNRMMDDHIDATQRAALPGLEKIVVIGGTSLLERSGKLLGYHFFCSMGKSVSHADLLQSESLVKDTDVLNLQFTSGTTGVPKAAVLSHRNIINNARFVGARMQLSSSDVLICPPPLFHCFGLVMGFLNSLVHGSTIVFPADVFDASATLDAIHNEKGTALLGVPTMFIAELELLGSRPYRINTVRTGLAAGSTVSPPLLDRIRKGFNVQGMLVAYGMTETSPVTFMMSVNDPSHRSFGGLGTVMPHTRAKVVNADGQVVPRGQRGELCTSGYALMKGYLDNYRGTAEVMKMDEEGITWMHTGDECTIDADGYCEITGRIKDIIIRGGENIFPSEIEERLLAHSSIIEASVVGVEDERYGEAVCCFLRSNPGQPRLSDVVIQDWVREHLGRHKAPKWIFWIGDRGVGEDFPKTGSGKYQKHIMRKIGNDLLKRRRPGQPRL